MEDAIKRFLISWNTRFRFDRVYRKKYNIRFNSKEHREINQIDIFLELQEERLFKNMFVESNNDKKSLKEYKDTGIFLRESRSEDEEVDFEKLMEKFNNNP
jgi:hypothetical protein